MTSQSDTPVWAKGDKCLSPYSGDTGLYRGVIRKLRRSPKGDVLALIKFDGYGDDDSEEVSLSQLQKVKNKERTLKPNRSYEAEGMFKPLQGQEFVDHLKAKFDADGEEESEFNERREKLSQVLFEKKNKSRSTPNPRARKGIVVIGGDTIAADRKCTPRTCRAVDEREVSDDDLRSPAVKKKCRLDISGGAAINLGSMPKGRPLSDISSIVDPDIVKTVLNNKHVNKTSVTGSDEELSEEVEPMEAEPLKGEELEKGEETSCDSGFDEEDLEKPKFNFPSCGPKVPYVLSEPGESPVIQVPATLNQYLRDYQRTGIQFLYDHYKNNRGAILGDDMGLGKTVQVIGFLSALLCKQGNRVDVMRQKPKFIRKLSGSKCISTDTVTLDPFLIIGPGCVLYNWLEEFQTWGYFTVRKFHGPDKQECLKEVRKGKVEVVVTTFETFREHQKVLNEISWSAVIADEVHKIKGLKAQTTKALRIITTTRRFGLTGTALQNNLLEFWSLLDWAQPGCLGRQADFEEEFVKSIEVGQRHDANKRELALARKKKEKFARVRQEMMIRRTKKIIAEQLPKKDDNVVFCKLSQLQLSMYETILNHRDMGLVLHGSDPCPCDSGLPQSQCCFKKTKEGQSVKALLFTFMHLLLKVSNHVALLIPKEKSSEKQARHSEQICKAAFAEHPDFMTQTRDASFRTLSNSKYCGKMKVLEGLLKVFYRDHSKILLFSYSTQVLDILEQHLMSTGYEYRRIDGSVSPKKRMIIVREFNMDPNLFICLVSTKAGGLGLNLTGANKVIIFDPNWNPCHDLQAQDRAYRIGQRRNVQVYRLVSAGTIEENMYLRQIYKQQLLNVTVEDENARRYFYAVQGNPRQKGELFGIKNMFRLHTGESCLTMDILKRNQRVETGLGGCEVAKYVPPPVIRVEEEEENGEGEDGPTPGLEGSESEEDLFEQFFATQGEPEWATEAEDNPDEFVNGYDNDFDDSNISKKSKPISKKTTTTKAEHQTESDVSGSDQDEEEELLKEVAAGSKGKGSKVRFRDDGTGSNAGKVRPSQSRKGKGPLRALKKGAQHEQYDQTLGATFDDVSDVFDQCGVVHIHENLKVVGGSRAEDHMTKCAITDVYELHQNSQDLAVQCEPMSESSEDETEKDEMKKKKAASQLNNPRSLMIGGSRVLIGQTPKFYRQKQFEDLSKFHGASSLLEFAELVLKSSLQERVSMLNKFYGSSDEELKDVLKLQPVEKMKPVRNTPVKPRKAKTESTSSKKKRQYLKVRHSPGVGFIDDELSTETCDLASPEHQNNGTLDSKSLSPASHELSVPGTGDEVDGSYLNVTKLRKNVAKTEKQRKLNGAKGRKTTRSVHEERWLGKDRDLSYDVGHTDVNHDSDDYDNIEDEEKSVSVNDLLCEMSRYSEEVKADEGQSNNPITQTDRHKDRASQRGGHKNQAKSKTVEPTTDILDDLFGDSDFPITKRKPPPSRTTKGVGSRKAERNINQSTSNKDCKTANVFKDVDEIISASANSGSDSGEVQLDASTLKDDDLDCFSDPTKWKTRKKKKLDRRNVADRLIADSEAEFDALFRSGKLKRKAGQTKSHFDNKESVDEVDGSMSLFS